MQLTKSACLIITKEAAHLLVKEETPREDLQIWVKLKKSLLEATKISGFLICSLRDALCLCKLFSLLTMSVYSYFFLPIVFPDTLAYIMVLMLSSIDFWVVKNIVGRKLVKMRWWYMIDNDGNERWHYESRGKSYSGVTHTSFRGQHCLPR